MFGFGTSIGTVFASRWKAVTWSLGVLLLAYCSVPAADETREHEAAKTTRTDQPHKSPWSKD